MRFSLRSLVAVSLFCLGVSASAAQELPGGTVKIIVPAAAGSAPDIVARLLSEGLAKAIDNAVIVENKVGGNGIVAINSFQRAEPDGHTLALFHAAAAITTPIMYEQAKFDIQTDTEIVSSIAYTPMVFVANKESGFKTLKELVEAAKKQPNEIVIGAPSYGSVPHLTAALLSQASNTKMRFVNFTGTSQAIQALVAGDMPVYINGAAPLLPLINSDRVVALANTSDEELPEFARIPMAKDTVDGLVSKGWFVMLAPKGTPEPILERFHAELTKILQGSDVLERLKTLGNYPIIESRAQTREFLNQEKELWAKVIKEANIQPQ